ncbi:MAG: DUF21 domain-containing protein [Thermoguttaceae bacterium]|nr:DUF21 domain-containing protein [Thermoguttaceae bacterium]
MSYLLPWIPALAVLVVLSAFCSASEAAFFSLTPEQQKALRKKSVSGKLACQLLQNPDRLLSVLLFSNLIANMLFFGIVSVVALQIQKENTALAGVVSVSAFLGMLVFCEMVPKAVAVILPQTIAWLGAFPLLGLQWLCTPILPVLNFFKILSLRLFAPNFRSEPLLELEDLERAVDLSHGKKTSSPHDKRLLQAILSLSELRAEEVMRPRRHLPIFMAPVTLQDLREEDLSLGLVFVQEDERQDAIAKILDLKNLVEIPPKDFSHLERHAQNVVYLPWNLPVSEVIETLLTEKRDAAVVIDEFGATPGVVLRSDILEMIYVPDSERVYQLTNHSPVIQIGTKMWRISSLYSMRSFCRFFELELSDAMESTTLGGFVTDHLQKIPENGDSFDWNDLHFCVESQTKNGFWIIVRSASAN